MDDFPITIVEKLDTATDEYVNTSTGETITTRFGFRITYQNYAAVHLTVHKMDERPGFNRLLNEQLYSYNLALSQIWPIAPGAYGRLTTDIISFPMEGRRRRLYLMRIVSLDVFEEALKEVRTFLTRPDTLWTEEAPLHFCESCDYPEQVHSSLRTVDVHNECAGCGLLAPRSYIPGDQLIFRNEYNEIDEMLLTRCTECRSRGAGLPGNADFENCGICETLCAVPLLSGGYWRDYGDVYTCHNCTEDRMLCSDCGDYIFHDEAVDGQFCERCWDEGADSHRLIREWDYRPSLEFHPEIPPNPAKPLYIGIELEMQWHGYGSRNSPATDWLTDLWDKYEGLLYVKSDSSVYDGFEVVSHPMDPDWALENFPFDFFQEAIDLGATPDHESCGTHIHIDKAALTTAQMWKLMQLHIKLSDFCGIVGGRGMHSEYANWDNDTRNADYSVQKRLKEIARKKQQGFSAERYLPLNVQNAQTLELRYMASGIRPETIRKNIEWVQALYDFTEVITTNDVRGGVLDKPDYLVGWIFNETKFTALQDFVADHITIPTRLPSRSV